MQGQNGDFREARGPPTDGRNKGSARNARKPQGVVSVRFRGFPCSVGGCVEASGKARKSGKTIEWFPRVPRAPRSVGGGGVPRKSPKSPVAHSGTAPPASNRFLPALNVPPSQPPWPLSRNPHHGRHAHRGGEEGADAAPNPGQA